MDIGENPKFPDVCVIEDDFCYNTTLEQCRRLCEQTNGCKHVNYCAGNSLCYLYSVDLPLGKNTSTKTNADCFTTYKPSSCNYRPDNIYGICIDVYKYDKY